MRQIIFLHYIGIPNLFNLHMSRLQKKPAPTIIEPESFEEEEFGLEYQPEHPALAFQAALKAPKADHLEQYVEVDPFSKK